MTKAHWKISWKKIWTVHQNFHKSYLISPHYTVSKITQKTIYFDFLPSWILTIGEGWRVRWLIHFGSVIFNLSEITQILLKVHCWWFSWILLVLQDREEPQWSSYCLEIYWLVLVLVIIRQIKSFLYYLCYFLCLQIN